MILKYILIVVLFFLLTKIYLDKTKNNNLKIESFKEPIKEQIKEQIKEPIKDKKEEKHYLQKFNIMNERLYNPISKTSNNIKEYNIDNY